MTSQAAILNVFREGLDSSATIRVRRPGALFQVELPAFMGDGDAAQVYVEPRGDLLIVTDLGATRMRLSYERPNPSEFDEQLDRLAHRHGFRLEEGEVRTTILPGELVAATLGLVQIQAQSEMFPVAKRKAREATNFKEKVLEWLHEQFGERLEAGVCWEDSDPKREFLIDAVVHGSKRDFALSLVPNDLEAERAVGTRLTHAASASHHTAIWTAIPRDVEKLSSRSRARLMSSHHMATGSFEEHPEKAVEFFNLVAA